MNKIAGQPLIIDFIKDHILHILEVAIYRPSFFPDRILCMSAETVAHHENEKNDFVAFHMINKGEVLMGISLNITDHFPVFNGYDPVCFIYYPGIMS